MSNIFPLNLSEVDARTAETLAGVKRKLGMLPNLFATLAHSPVALNGYLHLSETLGRGRLSARQRELISIALAQANACEYCLSAHTMIGKSVGLSESEVHSARNGTAIDPVDKAVVELARTVNQSRGVVLTEQLEQLRSLGVDDGLIIEIVVNVALNVLTNYVNVVAGTEVDFPKVELRLVG